MSSLLKCVPDCKPHAQPASSRALLSAALAAACTCEPMASQRTHCKVGSASKLCSQRSNTRSAAKNLQWCPLATHQSPDAAGHRRPRPGCVDQAATLTHLLVTCPLASSSVGLVCSHLGGHHRRGRAASKHRPSYGGRPEDMEASFLAQAPLASPAAGHHLPALGSLPA